MRSLGSSIQCFVLSEEQIDPKPRTRKEPAEQEQNSRDRKTSTSTWSREDVTSLRTPAAVGQEGLRG